jgi:hypothetical protein
MMRLRSDLFEVFGRGGGLTGHEVSSKTFDVAGRERRYGRHAPDLDFYGTSRARKSETARPPARRQ